MAAAQGDDSARTLAEVGDMAHDLNNLLTAILGHADLLLSDRPEGDPDRAELEEIQTAGRRAAVLTKRLLGLVPPKTANA